MSPTCTNVIANMTLAMRSMLGKHLSFPGTRVSFTHIVNIGTFVSITSKFRACYQSAQGYYFGDFSMVQLNVYF